MICKPFRAPQVLDLDDAWKTLTPPYARPQGPVILKEDKEDLRATVNTLYQRVFDGFQEYV